MSAINPTTGLMRARRGGARQWAWIVLAGLVAASGSAGTAGAARPSGAWAGPSVPLGHASPGGRTPGHSGVPVQRRGPEHPVRDLRRRGPDEVRDLRRRGGDEARLPDRLATPGSAPLAGPGARMFPETRPAPLLAREQLSTGRWVPTGVACRLDNRTLCLAPGSGTLTLWCARRHLVFEIGTNPPARSAACPESAIEAVWLRSPGARAPYRIDPGACSAVPACFGYPPANAP